MLATIENVKKSMGFTDGTVPDFIQKLFRYKICLEYKGIEANNYFI
jgi:hypothetical protein